MSLSTRRQHLRPFVNVKEVAAEHRNIANTLQGFLEKTSRQIGPLILGCLHRVILETIWRQAGEPIHKDYTNTKYSPHNWPTFQVE